MRAEVTRAGRVDAPGCAPPSRDLRIDAICERYEGAWVGTTRPEIETYLGAVTEPERPALLRELLALDIELRRSGGERPTLGEYLARFPNFEDQVAEAFGLCPSARLKTLPFGAGVGPIDGPIPSIPGYEVLGVLGRGGMGVVYRARQLRLDRPCALKMILSGVHAGPEAAVRFLSEAQLIARLRHPNVVQIHALGAVDEGPFLELEYADGGSLSDRIDGTPWKPRQAAGLIAGDAGAGQVGGSRCPLSPGSESPPRPRDDLLEEPAQRRRRALPVGPRDGRGPGTLVGRHADPRATCGPDGAGREVVLPAPRPGDLGGDVVPVRFLWGLGRGLPLE